MSRSRTYLEIQHHLNNISSNVDVWWRELRDIRPKLSQMYDWPSIPDSTSSQSISLTQLIDHLNIAVGPIGMVIRAPKDIVADLVIDGKTAYSMLIEAIRNAT